MLAVRCYLDKVLFDCRRHRRRVLEPAGAAFAAVAAGSPKDRLAQACATRKHDLRSDSDLVTSPARTVTTFASNFSLGSCRFTCEPPASLSTQLACPTATGRRGADLVCDVVDNAFRVCPLLSHHFGEGLHHLVQRNDRPPLNWSSVIRRSVL